MKRDSGTPVRSVGRGRQTLADLAYQELLDAILYQRLRPGQALGLDLLAEQLSMSRTPVNLALSRLHADGLVSYNEHLGFTVRTLTAKEINDLYDLRLLYELRAIETGLAEATDDQIEPIAAIHEAIKSGTDWADAEAFRRFWELDSQFHRSIVNLSSNELLQNSFARLHYHIHGLRLGLLARQPRPFQQMLDEHDRIVAALRQRDPIAAQESLRAHILRSRDVSLARLAALPHETKDEGVNDEQGE